MKTKLFKITGVALLLIAAILIVSQQRDSMRHCFVHVHPKSGKPILLSSTANSESYPSAIGSSPSRLSGRQMHAPSADIDDTAVSSTAEGFGNSPGSRGSSMDQTATAIHMQKLVMPPAITLSENCRLPAASMAHAASNAENWLATRSPQIQSMNANLIDEFYDGIARDVAESIDWERELEMDPKTAEATVKVKPSRSNDRIRMDADEKFRAMFGNDAFNLHILDSANERMLPVLGD